MSVEWATLLSGAGIGMAYAMPIGPQNIFLIEIAAGGSFLKAIRAAAIISCVDFSLALACFFGLGFFLQSHIELTLLMLGGGSLFLLYTGYKLLKTNEVSLQQTQNRNQGMAYVIRGAFVLTWINPQALIDGSILLGGFRASLLATLFGVFLAGVWLGSASWFFSISILANRSKEFLSERIFLFIHRLCGLVLSLYGIKLLWNFWKLIQG